MDWLAAPMLFLAAAAAQVPTNAPTPVSLTTGNRSSALFESDWVLMNWALKFHDGNRDILLEPAEAQTAADDFRSIADADGDGRVTPIEYRAAREFILARY
jgi:hypothetical protein